MELNSSMLMTMSSWVVAPSLSVAVMVTVFKPADAALNVPVTVAVSPLVAQAVNGTGTTQLFLHGIDGLIWLRPKNATSMAWFGPNTSDGVAAEILCCNRVQVVGALRRVDVEEFEIQPVDAILLAFTDAVWTVVGVVWQIESAKLRGGLNSLGLVSSPSAPVTPWVRATTTPEPLTSRDQFMSR